MLVVGHNVNIVVRGQALKGTVLEVTRGAQLRPDGTAMITGVKMSISGREMTVPAAYFSETVLYGAKEQGQ